MVLNVGMKKSKSGNQGGEKMEAGAGRCGKGWQGENGAGVDEVEGQKNHKRSAQERVDIFGEVHSPLFSLFLSLLQNINV